MTFAPTLSENVVVTFEPKTEPSNGSETPTQVPVPETPEKDGPSKDVVRGPDGTIPDQVPGQPFAGPFAEITRRLTAEDTADKTDIFDTSWRAVLAITGTALIFVPSVFLPAWMSIEKLIPLPAVRSFATGATWFRRHILTKLIGVILLILPFML
jgi:hypothetical protein